MNYREKIEKQIEEWNSRHEWIEVKICHFYWNDYHSRMGFRFYESGNHVGDLSPITERFTPTKTATIYNISVEMMRIIGEAVKFLFDKPKKTKR